MFGWKTDEVVPCAVHLGIDHGVQRALLSGSG